MRHLQPRGVIIDGDGARAVMAEAVAAKEADGMLDPDAIAETFWQLHAQPRSAWTQELDLRPYRESF